ncbi:MAG: hypothetical protein ACRDY7_16630, partial [Acidimicrobiia bacterium]
HDQIIEVTLGDGCTVHSRTGPQRVFEPGDRVSVSVTGAAVVFPALGPPNVSEYPNLNNAGLAL